MKKIPQNRGLVRAVIVIVIALLILSYLGINIRAIIDSPTGQANFNYTQEVILKVWNYVKGPATYLYNDVFIKLIWDPAIESLTRIKNGQPTNIDQHAPTIKIQ